MPKAMKKTTIAKVRRDLRKVRKDLVTKKKSSVRGRAVGGVIYNGVAAGPKHAFGGSTTKKPHPVCLDARMPVTLGLPRAVAPYTVIRTSTIITANAGEMMIFCPFRRCGPNVDNNDSWMNWCGVRQAAADNTLISGDAGITPLKMPLDGLGGAAEVVPSALTVQVVNGDALQQAGGTYMMGRVNQPLHFGGNNTTTWAKFGEEFVSYYAPRMLAAGKLAIRGVKCSAYPIDMSEYSSFKALTYSSATRWNADIMPGALTPIVLLPNQNTINGITAFVTIEWRVRFDPLNPATASHTHHPTLSDEAWDGLIRGMSAAGHGVEEVAEAGAEAGAMGYAFARTAGAIAMA